MCEANAYLKNDNAEYEIFLECVDKVIPNGEELILEDIFGKRKTIKAHIEKLELLDHKIMLER